MGKQAQISAFVILGAVIVFSLVAFVWVTVSNTKSSLDYEYLQYSGPVSRDKVIDYVQHCIVTTAEPAIVRMAQQGGYTEIPLEFYTTDIGTHQSDFLSDYRNPYVSLTKLGSVQVPYALINGKPVFPSILEMEADLSSYLSSSLDLCVQKFSPFLYDLDVKELSTMNISAKITRDSVNVLVDYPVNFVSKDGDRSFSIDTFRSEVPYRLGYLHEIASELLNYQLEKRFLENLTLQTISITDFPYEGFEFAYTAPSYSRTTLEERFRNYLSYNFRLMTFDNTNYTSHKLLSGSNNNYYNAFFHIPFTDNDYSDVRIETQYLPYFPLYFDVAPRAGDRVTPINLGVSAALFKLKIYHHTYDIKYPLVFRLQDEFAGKTLDFNLAIPVHMLDNKPEKYNQYFPFGRDRVYTTNEIYCGDEERLDTEVIFEALDDSVEDRVYLDNVSLMFSCGELYFCELGVTKRPSVGNLVLSGTHARLKAKLPFCSRGEIVASKDGYLDASAVVISDPLDPESNKGVLVHMVQDKKLEMTVFVEDTEGFKRPLDPTREVAFITLEDNETKDSRFFVYPSNSTEYGVFSIPFEKEPRHYRLDVKVFKGQLNNIDEAYVFAGFVDNNFFIPHSTLSTANIILFPALTSVPPPINTSAFITFYDRHVATTNRMPLVEVR